ncbi:Alpha-glucan water dikinase, chloroplastic [Vitis vinifera]|uniref:Alpha-glucan water dikinase, chloroplastic n=1 Tax=Vitis vinifera TaxID=29760 RepID=A0A438E708_VITVI|nr:Alpha-glucan water dikinase, chloroplastic [Vitis vinifera]
MSNTIGHNLLHKSLLRHTLLEHQSKISCSGVSGNALFQAQSPTQIKKSPISTKFRGNRLNLRKTKLPMGTHHLVSVIPRAVLTTDTTSEQLAGKFCLDENIELQVDVSVPTPGSMVQVNIQVTNCSNSLLLHWGAIRDTKGKWVLPSHSPDGTKVYKNKALRTPFVKSGSKSILKIEVDDPAIQAIEFLIVDETHNKWFKNNGENFSVKLPVKGKMIPNASVPEELVQIQAYLRWERKGKQMYTPEQEKASYYLSLIPLINKQCMNTFPLSPLLTAYKQEEYEAARTELVEEIARGTSIEDMRTRLTNESAKSEIKEQPRSETKSKIPDELVQVQAYIRWEKAGKPNYTPDQQLREFEEARKDLQTELEKGLSLDEIQKKMIKGEIQVKVSKQQKKLTAVEQFAKLKEEQDSGSVLNKKIYKISDKELLVLVTKPAGKTKVYFATDSKEPLTLHWAVSKKAGEWLAPPPSVLPLDSISLNGAVQTQFVNSSSADPAYEVQTLKIEIEEDSFVGMPFVLLSQGNWIKNGGSDFYIEFRVGPKQVKKVALCFIFSFCRFNIAADLMDQAISAGKLGLAGIVVWMRFMATRQLVWNKNYNVKPREISKAQDRLTDLLQNSYKTHPQYRELLRMIMSTVGRGGEGDVGQRIRDEILVLQRNNDCKGAMMEEWHQKLHNNTSPDDVIICQALIDYIKCDFDISAYWKTLNENGITKERLLSYDRGIHSEPNFRKDQKDGLLRDLGKYMRTLKAVHSGADLESAISNCMGYRSEGQGFMVGVKINPIQGLPSGFPELLQFVLEHVEDKNVEPLLEGLLEARQELQPLLIKSHDRMKDLLFLDIALDSTVRTAIERGYEELNNAGAEKIMYFITLVLENLVLSSDDNEDLIYCLKDTPRPYKQGRGIPSSLQPSAEYLGSLLGVDQWAVNIFTEDIIRAGSAASLSSLLNRLDPVLRKTANLGSWQVISPVEAVGRVVVVGELLTVQNKSYGQPTILVVKTVKGEEEIPDGAVAVLTPDMPDVLSHVSVRARNGKVCFATCFDPKILADLQANEGKLLHLKPTSADIVYSAVKEGELTDSISTKSKDNDSLPSVSLVRKQFGGRYAISSEEFTSEMVGAKSRNISYLKGKVPLWVQIPTSVALPFGVFEKVLSDGLNKEVSEKLRSLKGGLGKGNFAVLTEIRKTVLQLSAPSQLVCPSDDWTADLFCHISFR